VNGDAMGIAEFIIKRVFARPVGSSIYDGIGP
jgi:hypothetical protein